MIYEVCNDIARLSEVLKEFFVAGLLDRSVKSKGNPARAVALKHTEIVVELDGDQPAVRLNRGLLFLHLWNVIDNAFRYANLADEGLALTLKIRSDFEKVILIAINNGVPIAVNKAGVFNKLFAVKPERKNLQDLEREIQGWGAKEKADSDIEGENRGVGLCRFNEYLARLWDHRGKPEVLRGRVERLPGGTRFEFYFPRE